MKYYWIYLVLLSFWACNQPVPRTVVVAAEVDSYDYRPQLVAKGETVAVLDQSKPLQRIAFGSCNRQDKPQPLWGPIIKSRPDLWIWLGDNIYGDSEQASVMKAKYDKQLARPGYKMLTTKCPVIGTWDDHDYGRNDGDKRFKKKEQNKQLMLDFLGVRKDAKQRKRPGAYSSYTIGHAPQQVKIILLDSRWFKDPCEKVNKQYVPNETGDILGMAQWKWLKEELDNSKASVNIIANGTQVIPTEHPFEKWANHPKSRRAILKLIDQSPAKGIILLSGDRHMSEFSKIDLPSKELYEFTASGLTHTWKDMREEPNRYRIGEKVVALNFGLMEFDWSKKPVEAKLQIKGKDGKVYREEVIALP